MAITKVDLANVVTGVLPVANGGTGTSTGVAPGGSTTQVQYNNAGAFGGDSGFVYSGGNVGIGTSSPATKLNIYTASATGTYLRSENTAGFLYTGVKSSGVGYVATESNTALELGTNGTVRATIDTSGNLGLGVTPGTWSLGKTIAVNGVGNAIWSPNTINDIRLASNIIYNGGYTYAATGYANMYIAGGTNGYHTWWTAPSGTAGAAMTLTQAMTLDASGNLGIGATSPTQALHIYRSSGSVLTSLQSGSDYAYLGNDQTYVFLGSNIGSTGVKLRVNRSAPDNSLTIDNSGNLQFNSGYGSAATAYGCRAWVNFNGTGTVAIRASGNVSSITDNGTGNFTVNFSTALVDASYTISGMSGGAGSSGYVKPTENTSTTMLTTYCTIRTVSNTGGSDVDQPYTLITIVR